MRLEHPEPFGDRWRGRWICHGQPEITTETLTRPIRADPVDKVVPLRRTFDLGSVPAAAWVCPTDTIV